MSVESLNPFLSRLTGMDLSKGVPDQQADFSKAVCKKDDFDKELETSIEKSDVSKPESAKTDRASRLSNVNRSSRRADASEKNSRLEDKADARGKLSSKEVPESNDDLSPQAKDQSLKIDQGNDVSKSTESSEAESSVTEVALILPELSQNLSKPPAEVITPETSPPQDEPLKSVVDLELSDQSKNSLETMIHLKQIFSKVVEPKVPHTELKAQPAATKAEPKAESSKTASALDMQSSVVESQLNDVVKQVKNSKDWNNILHHETSFEVVQDLEPQVEKPSANFKQLVDRLWVQGQLGDNMKGDASSLITMDKVTVDASGSVSTRVQLVNDMQALVSKAIATKTGGEMTLNLHPGHLGRVRVDLQVEGSHVQVSLQAEKSAAQSLLQSQSQDLKQQLQVAGLKVDEIQVSSMDVSSSHRQSSSEDQSRNPYKEEWKHQEQARHQRNASEEFASFMNDEDERRAVA